MTTAPDIGLDLRLTNERCTTTAAAPSMAGFLAMMQGGTSGACNCRLARVSLTVGGIREAAARGIAAPAAVVLCVNAKCGRGLADMKKLEGLLELLR